MEDGYNVRELVKFLSSTTTEKPVNYYRRSMFSEVPAESISEEYFNRKWIH